MRLLHEGGSPAHPLGRPGRSTGLRWRRRSRPGAAAASPGIVVRRLTAGPPLQARAMIRAGAPRRRSEAMLARSRRGDPGPAVPIQRVLRTRRPRARAAAEIVLSTARLDARRPPTLRRRLPFLAATCRDGALGRLPAAAGIPSRPQSRTARGPSLGRVENERSRGSTGSPSPRQRRGRTSPPLSASVPRRGGAQPPMQALIIP